MSEPFVMDDGSIQRHLARLRETQFPPAECEQAIDRIVTYAVGSTAEDALREILNRLPDDDTLNRLIDRYVTPYPSTAANLPVPNWIEDEPVFIDGLHDRLGIGAVDGPEGWVLTLADGTSLVQDYDGHYDSPRRQEQGLPDRGHALAKVALLSVWITLLHRPAA